MNLVYALEPLPDILYKSIFLAGPTPRDDTVQSWRLEAIKILKDDLQFNGTIFIPEPRSHCWHMEYDSQIEWEDKCLNVADAIVFWIPRNLLNLPGFTTNIEWGRWESSGKAFLGYPSNADKMSYINLYAEKLNISISKTLSDTLKAAVQFIGTGAKRIGGERMVPYYIWNTEQFQSWYQNQVNAGNRIDDARVLFQFIPKNKNYIFLFILQCDMYISKENRHKTNEFLLTRPDISSVVLWYKNTDQVLNSEIVLIKEYRTCSSMKDGYIRELPGGSTEKCKNPVEIAVEEVEEETGFKLNSNRLTFHGKRQLAGTLSSHNANLFSVQLNEEEMNYFRNEINNVHGLIDDTERCYIEISTLKDVLSPNSNVDWTTVGQIMSVVMAPDNLQKSQELKLRQKL